MSKDSRPPPIQNQLLAALPGKEYKRLVPQLESVPLPFMEALYESGEPIKHVYFPNEGLISLLVIMADKTPSEVGLIGNEGMLHSGDVGNEDHADTRHRTDTRQRHAP
jgi:CRP-like cAMP-binding protein